MNELIIIPIIIIVAIVIYIVRKNRKVKKVTNGTGSRVAAPRWIVGGYNAQTNKTWVFPEGNINQGHYVDGTVNIPQGMPYTPHN